MLSLNFKTRLALSGARFLPVCGGPGGNPTASMEGYRTQPVKRLTLEAGL